MLQKLPPEAVFTPSGKGIAEFSLGLNRRFTTATGEKGEEVSFVQRKAFGRTGEIAVEYLRKGDLAGVQRGFVNYPAPILIGLRRLSIKCVMAI